MNKERIQALIKANRESKNALDMSSYAYHDKCGTTCCVLGNYAMRTDLQNEFELKRDGKVISWLYCKHADDFGSVHFASHVVMDHFDISREDAHRLFSPSHTGKSVRNSCNTPQEAADWIERWMEAKENDYVNHSTLTDCNDSSG